MSYFSDSSQEESERRNNAFNYTCALREAITIAKRSQQPVPYRRVIELMHDFSPELYKEVTNLLTRTNESEIVRLYKQKAAAETIRTGEEVLPEQLIQREIDDLKNLRLAGEETNLIHKQVIVLEVALDYFMPDDISENYLLNHDFNLNLQHEFFEKKIYDGAKMKDYKLRDNRILRIRLLHPDLAERIIGSDLVYEQFDIKRERVRFIHLQYKTWDRKKIYFSQGNLTSQLDKLDQHFCTSGFCKSSKGKWNSGDYRYPFCSAFLRPTNNLTKPDSILKSSGIHLPICKVNKLREKKTKITGINSKKYSVSSKIFEESFIAGHLGSRWISFNELDDFYQKIGLNSETSRIRVHAQEILFQTEEEANKER